MMKSILFALILIASPSAFAVSGKVQRTQAEQTNSPPTAATTFTRDCDGNGKPSGMKSTIVVVGAVTTITETDGINTWVSTVDTSVAGTTAVSCPKLQ